MPRNLLRAVAAVAVLVFAGQGSFHSSSGRSYTVQAGDTLWALSIRYGVPLNQLAAVNHMRLSDLLLVGRRLDIPSPGAGPTQSSAGGGHDQDGSSRSSQAAASQPSAGQPAAAPSQAFCASYQPPSGPAGQLPPSLAASPGRLALRPLFVHWGQTYGVPPDLLEAIAWQESGWQNDALSSAGAQGIGQLMPDTVSFVNDLLGIDLQATVPSDNIRMEARYMAFLLRATGNQVCDAVASYYQGLGALQDVGVLPESQVYVRSVLAQRPHFR